MTDQNKFIKEMAVEIFVDAIMDQEHTISEFFEIYYNIRFGDFEDFMEALEAAALIELENYFE